MGNGRSRGRLVPGGGADLERVLDSDPAFSLYPRPHYACHPRLLILRFHPILVALARPFGPLSSSFLLSHGIESSFLLLSLLAEASALIVWRLLLHPSRILISSWNVYGPSSPSTPSVLLFASYYLGPMFCTCFLSRDRSFATAVCTCNL